MEFLGKTIPRREVWNGMTITWDVYPAYTFCSANGAEEQKECTEYKSVDSVLQGWECKYCDGDICTAKRRSEWTA